MSLTVAAGTDLDLDGLLTRISVRSPYFGYDRIEERAPGLLAAPVPPAAPVLPEGGPYQAGAAARHLAILGACSVAYRRDEDTRHHYLATRANYLRGARSADLSEGLTAEALGTVVGRKGATARTRLIDSAGRVVVTLDVEYVVMSAPIFERLHGDHRVASPTGGGPGLREWLAGGAVQPIDDGLRVSLGVIPESVCAGHFPEYPAAPVAVVMDGLGHTAMRVVQERFDLTSDTPVVYEEGQVDAQGLAFAGQQLEMDVRFRDLDHGVAVVEGHAIADGEIVGRGLFRICQVGGAVSQLPNRCG